MGKGQWLEREKMAAEVSRGGEEGKEREREENVPEGGTKVGSAGRVAGVTCGNQGEIGRASTTVP